MLDQPIENALHLSSVWSVSCCLDPFLLKRACSTEGVVHQWPYHVPVNMHLCVYRNANIHSRGSDYFPPLFGLRCIYAQHVFSPIQSDSFMICRMLH